MIDLISMIFGVCMFVGICWLCINAGLLERGEVDRSEDSAQAEADVARIVEVATGPAPLAWDNVYIKRPHIRAGTK